MEKLQYYSLNKKIKTMITFNRIGYMGRLGNQMFQYASLMGASAKTGYSFGIPIKNNSKINKEGLYDPYINEWIEYKLDLEDGFNISVLDSSDVSNSIIYNEMGHEFNQSLFNIKDGVDLNGYFQTEKYFKHIENDIRKEFTFKDEIIKESTNLKGSYENIVSIHFRRGDFLGYSNNFPPLELEYYQTAINYFSDKDYTFYIFSDDIDWCKTIFGNDANIIYIESNNQFIDMCLMSMCDHNIIANSTYSWWGAWLNKNPNKRVIAPTNWFGPGLSHVNVSDIIPENWIKI